MAETNAMIEIRYNDDPRNRVIRTINARSFLIDSGSEMIRIDDVLTLVPDTEPELRKVVMKVAHLRDLLGQLGYVLMQSEDAEEIIQQYNEGAPAQRCPKCGHQMEWKQGWQCAGYVCPECGHEDADNTYH